MATIDSGDDEFQLVRKAMATYIGSVLSLLVVVT